MNGIHRPNLEPGMKTMGLMCQEQHQGKLVSECLDWFEQAAKQDHA